jgi:hypothetical protein
MMENTVELFWSFVFFIQSIIILISYLKGNKLSHNRVPWIFTEICSSMNWMSLN